MAVGFTDWNYNDLTGAVMEIPSPVSAGMRQLNVGWHGPFQTKQEALDFYAQNKAAHPDWKAPAGFIANVSNAAHAEASALTGGVSESLSTKLGNINLQGWFVRIGEIILGIVLVGVGISKLAGLGLTKEQLMSAIGIAGKAAK